MLKNQVKYHHGIDETIMAKKPQVETGKPKVFWMDVVAAQESGSARPMYDGIVILKKRLYHVRRSSAPFVILMSARKITYGKHNGTTNQLMPPWPEYVKLRPVELDLRLVLPRFGPPWNGTPLSKDNVRRELASVLDKLGLKRGGLHAFRHGRVSVLQEEGVSGDLVKEWIGHSSLRTTCYTQIRPEFRERVAAEVGLFRQKEWLAGS